MFFIDLIKYSGNIPHVSTMQAVLYWMSNIVWLLFSLMYMHQLVFLVIGTFRKHKLKVKDFKYHSIGVVVSARNESAVISNLIDSIKANKYPSELVTIFVVADNCTDNTADICRELGCVVFERFDTGKVGKGYALNYLFTKLHTEEEYAALIPDAYIVFDADNVVMPDFIYEINRTYDAGYEIVTSYRNSKNYGQNWLTQGYAVWFLHEARHLNNCRMMFGSSCAISGTGFLISTKVVKEFGNWNFFTLTEDIQCSTEYALTGRKIGYCSSAETFDEQPSTFSQSFRQRERWAKGFYQVFGKDGLKLLGNSFKRFSCWDMLTNIFPALCITLFTTIAYPLCAVIAASIGDIAAVKTALLSLFVSYAIWYVMLYVIGLLTTISEWKKIKATTFKKLIYTFTFPLFMMTYLPPSITAMLKKVEWKPIKHSHALTIEEITK